MNVLVDTSVWSRALRRPQTAEDAHARELAELVGDGRAFIIGPVRQELLSGVKSTSQFDLLRSNLRAFPDLAITTADYEEAAGYFNRCRAHGIQGSNTDFLICAVAARRGMSIFTTDKDFAGFASVLRISLHGNR